MIQSAVQCCDVKLRFSCPADIDIVKELCKQWFPIKYPDSWYEDITASNKFYTLVATINEQIIGLLVAEIKPYSKCNYEDFGLLCKTIERTSRVAYILTIGVVGQWRRHGIATILLNKLTENLTTNPMLEDCKAIYLHVLTTNTAAIHFYEKSHFKRHKFLPLYYLINSAACDGYCYVSYINGGQPPQTVLYPFHPKSALSRMFGLCCLLISLGPLRWTKTMFGKAFSSVFNKLSYSQVRHKGHLYTC